ncbi:hypothetical protein V490_08949, partial [Pseudogymnoascus sp. VKM F-3557]
SRLPRPSGTVNTLPRPAPYTASAQPSAILALQHHARPAAPSAPPKPRPPTHRHRSDRRPPGARALPVAALVTARHFTPSAGAVGLYDPGGCHKHRFRRRRRRSGNCLLASPSVITSLGPSFKTTPTSPASLAARTGSCQSPVAPSSQHASPSGFPGIDNGQSKPPLQRTRGPTPGQLAQFAGKYGAVYVGTAFRNGASSEHARPEPRKAEHVPPPPVGDGFTRSPKEDDVIVCPACDEELVVGPEEPAAPTSTPTATGKQATKAKARSRKDREEHPFWVVRECGHVYCNKCYQSRKPDAKSTSKSGFPEAQSGARKVPLCAVDDCTSEVGDKKFWVGVFM